jgi:hypothetical protein
VSLLARVKPSPLPTSTHRSIIRSSSSFRWEFLWLGLVLVKRFPLFRVAEPAGYSSSCFSFSVD